MPTDALSLQEAADELGVHYMTAYKYVRTGKLHAERIGGQWRIDPAVLQAFRHRDATTTGPDPARFCDRLIAGDELGAWSILEDALSGGMAPSELHAALTVPALRDIGDRWERGELTVADEHVASMVTIRLLGRLSHLFHPRGRRRGTIVLGAASGDRHGLPCMLAADQLRAVGFDCVVLGPDTPSDSFVETADACTDLVAVLITVTSPDVDPAVADVAGRLRARLEVPIVVGGSGVRDAAHADALGSSLYASTVDELIDRLLDPGEEGFEFSAK